MSKLTLCPLAVVVVEFPQQSACLAVSVTPVSSHDIRRSAGQWMVDIGVPLEIVSKFMRHKSIVTTQRCYADMREEDVADRLLDSIDARLATAAHKARGERKLIETIKEIPLPKEVHALYTVDGITKTLDAWAAASGIPKGTLYYRVVTMGSSMADALALGRAKYTRRTADAAPERCDTGVTVSMDKAPSIGRISLPLDERTVEMARKMAVSRYARCDSNTRHSASKADALSS